VAPWGAREPGEQLVYERQKLAALNAGALLCDQRGNLGGVLRLRGPVARIGPEPQRNQTEHVGVVAVSSSERFQVVQHGHLA